MLQAPSAACLHLHELSQLSKEAMNRVQLCGVLAQILLQHLVSKHSNK